MFSNGFNFLFSYVYIREKSQIYFNDQDTFSSHLTWQDSDQPRHRFSAASAYELPIGRGRTYFSIDSQGRRLPDRRLEVTACCRRLPAIIRVSAT